MAKTMGNSARVSAALHRNFGPLPAARIMPIVRPPTGGCTPKRLANTRMSPINSAKAASGRLRVPRKVTKTSQRQFPSRYCQRPKSATRMKSKETCSNCTLLQLHTGESPDVRDLEAAGGALLQVLVVRNCRASPCRRG
jgi:hypothetical protein